MAKLTPPAIQNLKRREIFFKSNSEFPSAKAELERIEQIKDYKRLDNNWNTLPKKNHPQDGAEYYKKLKQKEVFFNKDINKKQNPFKRLLKIFNRVK